MGTKTLHPEEVMNLVDADSIRTDGQPVISKFWSAVIILNVVLLSALVFSLVS